MNKRYFSYPVFIVMLLVTLFALVPASVQALGQRYFDYPTDIDGVGGGSPVVNMVIGQTAYVQKTAGRLKAYFPTDSGKVIFENYQYCPSGTDEGPASSKKSSFRGSAALGQIRVNGKGSWSSIQTVTSDYVTAASGKCNDSLTFEVRNLKTDPAGSGMYVVSIDVANVSNGYMNYYKIRTPTAGGVVSHAKGGNGWDVTVDQIGSTPKHTNYKIRFGSDCSVDTSKIDRRPIRLYDLDGPGGSGAQVGKITMKLFERNLATGATDDVKIANGKSDNTDPYPKGNGGSTSLKPVNKANADQLVYFTAKPNRSYVLELNNIYYNNTIQYGSPFDGIFYKTGCQNWNTEPSSYVRNCSRATWGAAGRTITASRGSTICFKHTVKGLGPGLADTKGVIWDNWKNGNKMPGSWSKSGYSWRTYANLDVGKIGGPETSSVTIPNKLKTTIVTAPDGTKTIIKTPIPVDGSLYCQRFQVNPKEMTDSGPSGPADSGQACARVGASPAAYELSANIALNPPKTYSFYPNQTAHGWITSSGTVAGAHAWQIYAVRYSQPPSTYSIGGESNGADPCELLPDENRISDCDSIYTGNYPTTSDRLQLYTSANPSTGQADEVGTYLCFFARVQNPTEDDGDDSEWRNSPTMECAVSGISPKVQFWGYDVRTNGKVVTSENIVGAKGWGSWSEYGLLSQFAVTGMRSSASYVDPTITAANGNRLTFANTSSPSCGGNPYGCYGASSYPTQLVADLKTKAVCTGNAADVLPLGGMNLADSTILCRNGTVRIQDDIRTNDISTKNVRALPQMVIIADHIQIDDDVDRVDAWLITPQTGTITTCTEAGTDINYRLTNTICRNGNRPLVVNGPVITGSLYLMRTAGSGAPEDDRGNPAEIFNLRPDAFLWAYAGAGDSDVTAQTTTVTELPPRF